jgi:hypothetical protein
MDRLGFALAPVAGDKNETLNTLIWFSPGLLLRPSKLSSFLNESASRVGMAIRVRVPDPMGTGTGMIFYLWVAPVPDPNRDGYETGIFSHPRVIRRVPDTLLPL